MDTRILRALLLKEVKLMKRNPIVPKIIVMLPLMVMLVIPLVANLDVGHVGIAVVDNDRSQLSRRIVSDIGASEFMTVTASCGTYPEAMNYIDNDKADVILTIPADFEKRIVLKDAPGIDLAANGVNATKGSLGAAYASTSVGNTLKQWQAERGIALQQSSVIPQYMYNPTLNFRNYMIPGLMVMLIIIICGFLPTLNLVGEKESGTIESMNVSPVKPMTFVLSKLIPYWVAGMVVVTIGIIIGWAVYGLAPAGNIGAIYLAAILFTFVMSGLGIIIANKSASMLQSILIMFAVIMVFQLMSGLFTPISSMPQWIQIVTYGVPPRYFIEIVRGIYLKGATVADLHIQYLILSVMVLSFCLVAALTYRKQS